MDTVRTNEMAPKRTFKEARQNVQETLPERYVLLEKHSMTSMVVLVFINSQRASAGARAASSVGT